jgi:hypothetical protein
MPQHGTIHNPMRSVSDCSPRTSLESEDRELGSVRDDEPRALAREAGASRRATDVADIYGWFTEGLDTADLKDAKALLEELTPSNSPALNDCSVAVYMPQVGVGRS